LSSSPAVAKALSKLLADSYTLYLKTHNFHWNVTGPMFTTLHTLFETEYNELALAVDEIAERIRAIGHPAPGSYAQFSKLTSIKESASIPKAEEMLRQLVDDQETVSASARAVVAAAEKAGDEASADLGVRRLQVHEKHRRSVGVDSRRPIYHGQEARSFQKNGRRKASSLRDHRLSSLISSGSRARSGTSTSRPARS
jgi:starvation-inducible DNA-binding protein